ncbi:probable histone H2A.3 [Solanum tuberosum]|uniref:Histone H2A n=1 Tax=Solanum tuberosum TaxID=4113 RepID=M1DWW3_SOLTU|nr:PREDICTED: probable histone H2A.3 [Solanum tuberosum]
MVGKGKNLGSNAKRRSHSSKDGLQFLVAHIARFLKVGKYAKRVGVGAPVLLAVVLEYLAAEVLELAGIAARNDKKTWIIPRHIQLAIRFDKELNQFLRDLTIPNGGVIQRIHNIFLPNNKSNTSKVVVVAIAQEEED